MKFSGTAKFVDLGYEVKFRHLGKVYTKVKTRALSYNGESVKMANAYRVETYLGDCRLWTWVCFRYDELVELEELSSKEDE